LYQALYRKWRPRTFDDMVGQTHITDTLKRQVDSGRLSHAYLFTGTRGTGKTSCAKILARAVNCEHPVNGDPCNRCFSCLGIENGSIMDVLELDAASNNGVDQVRALRDEAIYTPTAVKKRVYIVDEVHMLSTAAFNALLKILEEPPAHLIFILATTELQKVPATIKSRCQQFAFKRILPGEIAGRLAYVAGQEGIKLTSDGAVLIARLADGSLRDAMSLLDQCMVPDASLGEEQVLGALGLAGNLETARLMDYIADRKTENALESLGRLYGGGKDVGALLGELSALCRDLLIRKTAPRGGSALLTGGYDETTLRRLSEKLTTSRLAQILGLVQTTMADLPHSGNRRTDAELCLILLCDETLDASAAGLTARLARVEELLDTRMPVNLTTTTTPQHFQPEEWESDFNNPPPWQEKPSEEAPMPAPLSVETKKQAPTPKSEQATARIPTSDGFWPTFSATLRGKVPPAVYSYLKNSSFVTGTYAAGVLMLWTDSEMTKKTVGKPEVLAILGELAGKQFGAPVRVSVTVGKPAPALSAKPNEKHDNLDDLLAMGRQFGNITIKE